MSLVEMALGRYPIPPPDSAQLAKIFGSEYDPAKDKQCETSAANYESHSPYSPHTRTTRITGGDHSSLSIFALLDYIVLEPPPSVPLGVFSPEFKDFVDKCLRKEPNERPDLNSLAVSC